MSKGTKINIPNSDSKSSLALAQDLSDEALIKILTKSRDVPGNDDDSELYHDDLATNTNNGCDHCNFGVDATIINANSGLVMLPEGTGTHASLNESHSVKSIQMTRNHNDVLRHFQES